MNLDNTTLILNKINRLYEIITDIGDASTTEKDLLKAYIKELYKSVSDGEELIEQASKPESIKDIAEITDETSGNEDQTSSIDKYESSENGTVELLEISDKMLEIFKLEEIADLSDKLSSSPIPDLTKAMGINEKIFTVKELFGGDQSSFDNMMLAINGLSSYDEAKDILIKSAAMQYDWDKPSRFKKARSFVKLIQRRFK